MLLRHYGSYRRNNFLRAMLSNNVMLLGQSWLGQYSVHIYLLVVTKEIRWSIDWKPKNAQIVAPCLYYLHCIIHRSELWSKYWCLNWVLPLSILDYWCNFEKQQHGGLRLSCIIVTRIIRINKTMCQHKVSSCNWHITWDHLLIVPIKLRQVTLLEPDLVDDRICWVKTQFPLRMPLQISKDIECLLDVPNSGHLKLAQ